MSLADLVRMPAAPRPASLARSSSFSARSRSTSSVGAALGGGGGSGGAAAGASGDSPAKIMGLSVALLISTSSNPSTKAMVSWATPWTWGAQRIV